MIWGRAVADVLDEMKVISDFGCRGWPDRRNVKVGEQIRYIHRRIDDDDVYFVASGCPEAREFVCTFRVNGKGPSSGGPIPARPIRSPYTKKGAERPCFARPLTRNGFGFRSNSTLMAPSLSVFRKCEALSESTCFRPTGNELKLPISPTPGFETQLAIPWVG